jgi:hypothetical protein
MIQADEKELFYLGVVIARCHGFIRVGISAMDL